MADNTPMRAQEIQGSTIQLTSLRLPPSKLLRAKVVRSFDDGTLLLQVGGRLVYARASKGLSLQGELLLRSVELQGKGTSFRIVGAKKEAQKLSLDPKLLLELMRQEGVASKGLVEALFEAKAYRLFFEAGRKVMELSKEFPYLFVDVEKIKEEPREWLWWGENLPKSEMPLWQLLAVAAQATGMQIAFMPLAWRELEENVLFFKRLSKAYVCKIYLRLRDIGRIGVTMILHERQLTLHLLIEDENFRKEIADSVSELRRLLESKVAVSIFVSPFKEELFANLLAQESIVEQKV